MNMNTKLNRGALCAVTTLAAALLLAGCGKSGSDATSGGSAPSGKKTTIANSGSDTMVNLAAAWAEAYGAVDKTVVIEVNGGGSGVGIKGLLNGTAELANSSRHIEDKEVASSAVPLSSPLMPTPEPPPLTSITTVLSTAP